MPLKELRDAARGVAFAGDEGEFVVGNFDDVINLFRFLLICLAKIEIIFILVSVFLRPKVAPTC